MVVEELTLAQQRAAAVCYAEVFAGPPWNEVWSVAEVLKMFGDRHMKWWVALVENMAVGFCAGWVGESDRLAKKLACSDLGSVGVLGYQADVGVLPQFRNHGIAKQMARKRLRWFKEMGVETLVIRTKPDAVTCDWNLRLGFLPAYQYPDGRVILSRPIAGLSL